MEVEESGHGSFRTDSMQSEAAHRSFRADSMQADETPTLMPSRSQRHPNKSQEYIRYLALYKAVDSGDIEATKDFLNINPEALTACLTSDGETALHIAVLSGHTKIVEELVKRLPDSKDLAIKNDDGVTALIYAATGGIVKIAECLVKKCPGLVGIANKNEQIPVVVASLYGHRNLVRYLYSVTPMYDLDPAKGKSGAMLITTCIVDGLYDIALDLVRLYPELAYTPDTDKDTALDVLAQTPSAFPSGTRLALWQRWIYSCIHIGLRCASGINGDLERPHEASAHRNHMIRRGARRFHAISWKFPKFLFPHIMHIYELKLKHVQAKELLSRICQEISTLDETRFESIGVYRALFKAVRHGIVEYVVEMMKHYPDIIWCQDSSKRNIFMYAARQRQEKIFCLIYRLGAKKNVLATAWDKDRNNMLHQAAYLAPAAQLDRVPGAALQMQRELQWFKEVESLVQPKNKEMVNKSNLTPQALFSFKHKPLVEQGEKWMKETAESCTVVAALIATMMFSAAFTIPGGYDNGGTPLYVNRNSFMVFIISDAMSLFASCNSILMFLAILKSRYREEDFLRSLPTKLIIGLCSLFFSIATMMVTFAATLLILLRDRVTWVSAPIVLLASLPVSMFVVLQFPVLVEIFCSTYGPGVFDKPKKFRRFSF